MNQASFSGKLLLPLLVFIVFTVFTGTVYSAVKITVDDDNPADYSTINAAISAALSGDTIMVAEGTYFESVHIEKPLVLIGAGSALSIIDAQRVNDVIAIISTTDVEIKGFTLQNSSGNRCGLSIYRSTFCKASDLNLSSNYIPLGINAAYGASNEMDQYNHQIEPTVRIEGKPLHYIFNQSNTIIEDLDAGGIRLAFCENVTLRNSVFTQGNVMLYRSSGCILDNVNSLNGFQTAGIHLIYAPNTTINNCESSEIRGHGLEVLYSDNAVITNSRFERISFNRSGININSSSNLTLDNNLFADNHRSFTISGTLPVHYSHTINTSNTAEGKPIYYLYNHSNEILSGLDAGYVFLAYCDNMLIDESTVISDGIRLFHTDNSTIRKSVITQCNNHNVSLEQSNFNSIEDCEISYGILEYGIRIFQANNNLITRCELSNMSRNRASIWIYNSSANQIYGNNFLVNYHGVSDNNPINNQYYNTETLEGNYWYDYSGIDDGSGIDKHAIAGDGIGDTDIPFPNDDFDLYPLMQPVIPEPENLPPVANAGDDQAVHAGNSVILDGSSSIDPDENYELAYTWTLISFPEGSNAALSTPGEMTTSLQTDLPGIYIVELVVSDALGMSSTADQVVISTVNSAPVADAGDDQAVLVIGNMVELNGSTSYDLDGDDLMFLWSISQRPEGSSAEIIDASFAQASFVPDIYGEYIIYLTVNDAWSSSTDEMKISFTNIAPQADAGNNTSTLVGNTVYLDGGASSDPNDDALIYSWEIVSQPSASTIQLQNSTAVTPHLTPDVAGDYIIALTVSDGRTNSDPSVIAVTAIAVSDALTDALESAIDMVNMNCTGNSGDFKNKNMCNTLTRKIAVVLKSVEKGTYLEAYNHLSNDILQKMDGCTTSGSPDKNDWVITCTTQNLIRPFIDEAIHLLEQLIN